MKWLRLLPFLGVLTMLPIPVDAAIALVSSSFNKNNSSTSVVPATGLAATAGDVQVACILTHTTGSITAPANFTLVDSGTIGSFTKVGTYVATSSLVASPPFSITAASEWVAGFTEWSGVNTTTPVDKHAMTAAAQSSGYTSSATAVTPTAAANAIHFCASISSANTVGTAPSGLTEESPGGTTTTSTPYSMRAYYQLSAGTSSLSPSLVWSGASGTNDVMGAYVVLNAAASASGPIAAVGTPSWANGTSTSPACSGLSATATDAQVVYLWTPGTSTATITPPSGYTLVDRNDYATAPQTIATYIATSSLVAGPTFTLGASATWVINCSEWSNVAGVDVHSAASSNPTGTSTTTSTAVTPTLGQDLFLAGFGRNDVDGIVTAPSGFSEVATGTTRTSPTFSAHVYSMANPAITSLQPGLVWNNTGNYYASNAYVVLKQTISGGVGPITVTGQGLFGGKTAVLTVSDPGNTSTITATSGNTGIFTVSPASYGSGTSGLTFTITGVSPGTTTLTIADTAGNANVQVVTFSLLTSRETLVVIRPTRGPGWPW